MRYVRRMIVVPAKDVDKVNTDLENAGWGPTNLSIPLEKGNKVESYVCDMAISIDMLRTLDKLGVKDVVEVKKEPGKHRLDVLAANRGCKVGTKRLKKPHDPKP